MTLSHAFALGMVLPTLPAFTARYPLLRVSLHVSNRREELAGEGFDVAIRNGGSSNSALVGRKLGSTRFIVVASP
ncbi:LysR substrate-binding domain-containing protein, partial [Listeria monocytogenes]|uniref:LysR substrate-binding domain-containing protein n=1 Tax=Listeria monocytogenes TaxID=1639 RepID=UPI003FA431BC